MAIEALVWLCSDFDFGGIGPTVIHFSPNLNYYPKGTSAQKPNTWDLFGNSCFSFDAIQGNCFESFVGHLKTLKLQLWLSTDVGAKRLQALALPNGNEV